jgi:hypothetical protein
MLARVLIWLFGVLLFVDLIRETVQPLAVAP